MSNSKERNDNWLADWFEYVSRVFDNFNPAAFKFLESVLPYTTPFPVATLTARHAKEFLGFDMLTSFVFVFGLEGMGLWFTSLFVDSVLDFIRSRNVKSIILVMLFGAVVGVYSAILIQLNVILKSQSGTDNPALGSVITLLCFLPLLSGIGNGYMKWKRETEYARKANEEKQEEKEKSIRTEDNDLKIKKHMIRHGMNPLVSYASTTPSALPTPTPQAKRDWRTLSEEEKKAIMYVLSVPQIMDKYGIGESTAYLWKSKKKTN